MRILQVQPGADFSVADVHSGYHGAFKALGCTVGDLKLGDRLRFYSEAHVEHQGEWRRCFDLEQAMHLMSKGIEAAAFEFWPDVVVITSGFYVPRSTYEVLRRRGMKVVLLCTESPYEDDSQLERAPFADLVILNDPTGIERFRAVNPNTHYFGHAYDPAVHYPRPVEEELASDFCFVGTGYPSRVEFFEAVDWTGIDAAFAGTWGRLTDNSPLRKFIATGSTEECIDNADTVRLYTSSKASANLYRVEANQPELSAGWSMGPREIELAACGVFFLRQPRGEGDKILPMLPTFEGPEDFGEQLRWWLDHEDLREKVAGEARMAIAEKTFDANARRLLSLLSD